MLVSVLLLLAGVGVFIAGMNMMGDGLESSAGRGMKKLFSRISDNRFVGVGIGTATTALIQSSSATTVMVIGFVNAGVMTLVQATSIIMGANIGTTITGILVSLKNLPIASFAAALSFVGVMMMFIKSDQIKKIGGIVCGLGLVFVGLDLMGGAISTDSPVGKAFSTMFEKIDFPLVLILLGAVFTAIIQSSSAATGVLITLAVAGAIGVDRALFIVLGTNIGTCITAVLASLGTSTNARRTAFIHLMFNMIGTILFTIILWPLASKVSGLLEKLLPNQPGMQIAWFHVLFNLTTTAVLLPFVKLLVKLASFVIKDKPSPLDVVHTLKYIDERLLHTPPIAVAQTQKEIEYMSELAKENLSSSVRHLLGNEDVNKEDFSLNEAKINFTYHAVASFLIKLSNTALSESDERLIGAFHHVISNVERIGDYAENFIEQADKMKDSKVDFSDVAVVELKEMYDKVYEMFELSMRAFSERNYKLLGRISTLEDEVDQMKADLGFNHIERLNNGDCQVERGSYFFELITSLERIADHLINIAYSIKNPTGSQSKRKELNSAK